MNLFAQKGSLSAQFICFKIHVEMRFHEEAPVLPRKSKNDGNRRS